MNIMKLSTVYYILNIVKAYTEVGFGRATNAGTHCLNWPGIVISSGLNYCGSYCVGVTGST